MYLMIALISDVHGNYEALKAVLLKIKSMDISTIFCLGDIAGYYTQINECCNAIRENNIMCILGNHDWYMISNVGCARSKSVNDCLEYQKKVITKDNLDWLASQPIYRNIGELAMVHGGWNDPLEEYLNPCDDYFSKFPNKFFASGHTHKAIIKSLGNKLYCNPGSVGQPRDKISTSSFATFDGLSFKLHRVDYDIDKVCSLMSEAGFSDYYFKRLRVGSENFVK